MTAWVREKLPKEYWTDAKYLVATFRKSMPIVSHRISDGEKTTKGKKVLGRTFAAPTWVSADLGDSTQHNTLSFLHNILSCIATFRVFSTAWQKLRSLFHRSTNLIWTEIYQADKKQEMDIDKTGS